MSHRPSCSRPGRRCTRGGKIAVLGLFASLLFAPSRPALAQSDWSLYAMRLANRARLDPAGEAARIGSSVVDARPPVAPLAYHLSIEQAAANHNDWMHDNLGGIASSFTPDSFTHNETLDGTSGGTPAVGTPSYTGVQSWDRISAVGFSWSTAGESLFSHPSPSPVAIDTARIEATHLFLWELSTTHRDLTLGADFALLGQYSESRSFVPPLGGLNPPNDNVYFATHVFSRPLPQPRAYVLGLLFDDLDDSGGWTPRDAGDPLREGRGAIPIGVYTPGGGGLVTTGATFANGAFSLNLAAGSYDLSFSLPEGERWRRGVVHGSVNTDLGDLSFEAEAVPAVGAAWLVLGSAMLLATAARNRREHSRR